MQGFKRRLSLIMGAIFAALLVAAPARAAGAEESPFDLLSGEWTGAGTARFSDGSAGRVRCRARYNGRGIQLDLTIFCTSESQRFEIESRLTYDNGKISGPWQENIHTAGGEAYGRASSARLSLHISGSVQGTMLVSYTKSKQTVDISTQGISLSKVNITLSRR